MFHKININPQIQNFSTRPVPPQLVFFLHNFKGVLIIVFKGVSQKSNERSSWKYQVILFDGGKYINLYNRNKDLFHKQQLYLYQPTVVQLHVIYFRK